jgi:hypothetical protein
MRCRELVYEIRPAEQAAEFIAGTVGDPRAAKMKLPGVAQKEYLVAQPLLPMHADVFARKRGGKVR